jgi:hypothetical protein
MGFLQEPHPAIVLGNEIWEGEGELRVSRQNRLFAARIEAPSGLSRTPAAHPGVSALTRLPSYANSKKFSILLDGSSLPQTSELRRRVLWKNKFPNERRVV